MRTKHAAQLAAAVFLVSGVFTIVLMRPGLQMATEWNERQAWLANNALVWQAGGWLWMLAILSWMVFLVALAWCYLPAHRISTMLQSGLMVIAATLAVLAVLVWVNVLPVTLLQVRDEAMTALVDALARSLSTAAFLMGGAVTTWIGVDLAMLHKLPLSWLWLGIAAGISVAMAPLQLFEPYLLLTGFAFFVAWCAFLSVQRQWPGAYAEWS